MTDAVNHPAHYCGVKIDGVGPDAELETTESGGVHSKIKYAFHLIDHGAMFAMAKVMAEGVKTHGRDTWRKLTAEEQYDHMDQHARAYLMGDTQEDHLAHMLCRAMMMYAVAKVKESDKKSNLNPEDVIATDFDGCLCTNAWPEIGEPNNAKIDELIGHRKNGGKVILWTCREGVMLEKARIWCLMRGLEFDAINDNLPERKDLYQNNCRKIGADQYWDDKAVEVKA